MQGVYTNRGLGTQGSNELSLEIKAVKTMSRRERRGQSEGTGRYTWQTSSGARVCVVVGGVQRYREGASMDQAPRTLQATGTLLEGHLNSVPHGTVTYPLDNSETLKHTGWGLCECDQISFAFEKAAGVPGTEKTGGRKSRGFCQDYGGLHKGLEHQEGMLGELTASGIPTPIATLNSTAAIPSVVGSLVPGCLNQKHSWGRGSSLHSPKRMSFHHFSR